MEAATTTPDAQQAAPPPRLRELYEAELVGRLTEKFGYSSRMQVPRMLKITLNMGVGDAKQSTPVLEAATEQLETIAGQHPNARRARKSIRDFRGLNPRAFDGRGNYSPGVREQLIFPEIDYDSIDEVRGLDIAMTTTAATDEEAFDLLLGLGMPFAQEGRPGAVDTAAERAEAEQAALEQLKEENPDAYAKPERPEEGEEGEEAAEGGDETSSDDESSED